MKLDLNSKEIWTIEKALYLLKADYEKDTFSQQTGSERTEMIEFNKKLIIDIDNLISKTKGLIEGIQGIYQNERISIVW